MPRLILFIFLLLLLYAILYYLIKDMVVRRNKGRRESEPEELVQDPYCQTYIPKQTAVRKRVKGRDYYFCTKECLRKFLQEKKT
ncbi:MAG: YHS domain-containing protein [Thermodesulfobacteriota bacterium]